jgi:hypothetical protein
MTTAGHVTFQTMNEFHQRFTIPSDPQCPIKGSVLNRFTDVLGRNVDLASGRVRPTGGLVIEIGDSAGYFQDAIVSTRA